MSSAACYTNRRRVLAEASVTKVQYPGRVATNNDTILSVRNCSPDYDIMNYVTTKPCCVSPIVVPPEPPQPPVISGILDGGNFTTQSMNILDGGNYATESTTILDGGNS